MGLETRSTVPSRVPFIQVVALVAIHRRRHRGGRVLRVGGVRYFHQNSEITQKKKTYFMLELEPRRART